MIIALLIAFAWAMGWLICDSYWTDKGIKAGLAVEGNWYLRLIVGNKPKFWQMMLINGLFNAGLLAISLLPVAGAPPHTWHTVSLVTLVVSGIMNIRGAVQWKWMFKHPGETIPPGDTFWQKFAGFWG